jgi:hypothetical protein
MQLSLSSCIIRIYSIPLGAQNPNSGPREGMIFESACPLVAKNATRWMQSTRGAQEHIDHSFHMALSCQICSEGRAYFFFVPGYLDVWVSIPAISSPLTEEKSTIIHNSDNGSGLQLSRISFPHRVNTPLCHAM